MKKFLFIIVPSHSDEEIIINNKAISVWNEVVPPYGALSIISYMKANSTEAVEFKIMDARLLYWELFHSGKTKEDAKIEIGAAITEFNPDFIGLSALFSSCYPNIGWVVDAIVNSGSKAVVIAGGALATIGYDRLFDEFSRIQICIISEGESGIKAVIEDTEPLFSWKRNISVVTRSSLQEGQAPKAQLIEDLDLIAPYDLSYIRHGEYNKGKKQIDMITSRGCPFECVFCAAHVMTGKKIRYYSVERICSDLEEYINLGYRKVRFFDDNFFYNADRAKRILNKIISFNIPEIEISFPSGVMVNRINEEVAHLIKKAGACIIPLAVESGSDYVLKKLIHKPVSKEAVFKAVNALKKFDIDTHIFLVVGLPGETDEHRKETIDFVKSLHVDWVTINVAIPLKGSRLYDICKEKGYLHEYDEYDFRTRKGFIKTPEFSADYIEHIAYRMNLEINFINNSNLVNKNYKKALRYFNDIITKYSDHAFAYYAAYLCGKGLNDEKMEKLYYEEYSRIVQRESFWKEYASYFTIL